LVVRQTFEHTSSAEETRLIVRRNALKASCGLLRRQSTKNFPPVLFFDKAQLSLEKCYQLLLLRFKQLAGTVIRRR
jgi:hypothetical protein